MRTLGMVGPLAVDAVASERVSAEKFPANPCISLCDAGNFAAKPIALTARAGLSPGKHASIPLAAAKGGENMQGMDWRVAGN